MDPHTNRTLGPRRAQAQAQPRSKYHRFYRIVTLAELVALVPAFLVLFTTSGPIGAVGVVVFVVFALFCVGLVAAIAGAMVKPRAPTALLSLGVHVLLLGVPLGWKSVQTIFDDRRTDRFEHELVSRRTLQHELIRLIDSKQLEAARQFVRTHEELALTSSHHTDGGILAATLCPSDHSAPHVDLLRLLSERGLVPRGYAILMEAAKCSSQAVEAALHLGTPLSSSAQSLTPMMVATDPEVLKLLLSRGIDIHARDWEGRTALMYHRAPEITKLLLAHGADPNAVDKLGLSALHYSTDVLIEGRAKISASQLVACYELLLKAGADPNLRARQSCDRTPLLAMDPERKSWHWEAAQILVRHGADPLAPDCEGTSATMRYLLWREESTAPRSIAWSGIDLAGKDGSTLLMEALNHRRWEVVTRLLTMGVNPGAPGRQGETPLAIYGRDPDRQPQLLEQLREAARTARADSGP